MREAPDCLSRAFACDTLAGQARDSSSVRVLREIADQWRQLARDTDRHKRQIGHAQIGRGSRVIPNAAAPIPRP